MLSPRTVSRITRGGLIIIAACLFALFSLDLHGWTQIGLIFGAILTACIIGVVREKKEPPPEEPGPPPLSGNFGSARYAMPCDVLGQPDVAGVATGLFFGRSSSPETPGNYNGIPICSAPGSHSLIVGKTRTGKGTRVILPSLLRSNRTSVLCIDPKGENAAVSARARSVHSDVYVMNPWGELGAVFAGLGIGPTTYNPLDVLDRNDPNAVAVAQALAAAICPPEGSGKDAFWNQNAAALLTAILLWQAFDQPEEIKTLARTREIIGLSRIQFKKDFLTNMMATNAFGGAIRENCSAFWDMAPETYSGVLANLSQYTTFLSDPQIKAATSTSSFSMTDLTGAGKARPTTLYVVIPPDRVDTQKTWLRLMITAGLTAFRRKPQGARYRCLFLIDEFPALGMINGIRTDIATMAGIGVDLALVVQNLAQIRELYGGGGENDIVSNCGYKWFCNVNDLSTAEYLSKTLGKKTVRTEHKGESSGESFDTKHWNDKATGKTTGQSTSYGEMGKDLLSVDEVLNLGPGKAILLAPSSFPVYLLPVDYWRLQEVFAAFRERSPNLYWPLFFDPNPYLALNQQAKCLDPLPAAPVQFEFIPPAYLTAPRSDRPNTPQPSAFQKFVNMFRSPQEPQAPPQQQPQAALPPPKIDFWRYAPDYMKKKPPAQPATDKPPQTKTPIRSALFNALTKKPPEKKG